MAGKSLNKAYTAHWIHLYMYMYFKYIHVLYITDLSIHNPSTASGQPASQYA